MSGVSQREGAHPDRNCFAKISTTSHRTYLITAVVWGGVLAFAGSLSLIKPIAQVHDAFSAWTSWVVLALVSSFWVYGARFTSILQGTQNVSLHQKTGAKIALLQLVVAALVLWLGGGLLGLTTTYCLSFLLQVSINKRHADNILREMAIPEGEEFDRAVFDAVWPSAWRSGIGIVLGYGAIQLSGIAYAQVVSAEKSAPYLLALRVMNIVRIISSAPIQSALPSLARMRAQGRLDAMLASAKRKMKLSYVALLLSAGAAGVVVPAILRYFDSETQFVSFFFWSLLVCAVFLERFGAMHLQLYSTTNHIIWHWANGVSGVIFVALSAALFPVIEVWAFPSALCASYLLFYSWYCAIHSYQSLSTNALKFESGVSAIPAGVMVAVTLASAWIHLA